MPAFDTITAEIPYSAIGANTARVFVFPTTLGIEHRIVNGRVYITAIPVTDPAEIERRAALFSDRAGFYYQHWDELYEGWKTRIRGLIDEIEAITVPALDDVEDIRVVTESRGVAQNHYLRENFHKCIDLYSKMWHHHTEFLMLGYGAYVVFFEFCKKAFPEISEQTVARMVAGIDVVMYRPDDELKRLARLAVSSGLAAEFPEGCDPDAVLTALAGRGEAGRAWLAEFDAIRLPWFHVSTGDGFYHHHLSWNDNLAVPFAALTRYVRQVQAGESLARPTAALVAERDRIASEYRALLPSDAEREAFDQMLGLCRLVFPYVEDHKFYCEHWFTTRFFQQIRAFGALLAARGVLAEADDVFQLHHTEIDQALADVMLAWAAGSEPLGAAHLRLGRHRRGHRPGAARRQRHRPDPGRGDPGLPGDRAELGPRLRQDQGRGLGHRRHHVPRRHRGPRVRHAGGGRHRSGHQADPDRAAGARGRRPRRGHGAGRLRTGVSRSDQGR
jgi:pyruvate,water dikinase